MSKPFFQRAGALLFAVLFLGTAVASGIFVLIEMNRENKANTSQTSAPENPNDKSPQTEENKMKLEGTKLEGFTPVPSVTAVQSTDIQQGTGAEVKPGATITFHYTGALAKDGTIFQSSYDMGKPVTLPLTSLIKGWQTGIPGMKVDGKRRLLIPAAEAYGAQETPGIPANSDLVFDIEVTAVQ